MKEAVIYARFSSNKQREESISAQLRECHAFAESEGLTVIHEYIDRAMSARTDQRPSFLQMIQDSDKKLFSYVIVYQLDRFSRSRYDSAVYKHRLQKNGVRVLSAKEHITTDPTGILLEALIEANAELYSAELSQKVTRGMLQNVLEGKWPGGNLPLGYQLDDEHRLVLAPEKAPTVQLIYEWYLKGLNEARIIRKLNAEGYQTSVGRPFTRTSIHRILRNPIYLGTFRYKGKLYPHFAPPLLTKQIFYQVQTLLDRHEYKHVVPHGQDFALVGKAFCGLCGNHLVGTSGTSHAGVRYCYYMCASRTHILDRKAYTPCKLRNIRADWLEAQVYHGTLQILYDSEVCAQIAQKCAIRKKASQTESPRLKQLKALRKELQHKLDNSIQAIESGIFSKTISDNIGRYEKDIQKLDAKIKGEKLLSNPVSISEDFISYFLEKIYKQKKDDGQIPEIFQTFIHRITVFTTHIAIQYAFYKNLSVPETPVIMRGSNKSSVVRLEGFEPSHPVPETGALSPEL